MRPQLPALACSTISASAISYCHVSVTGLDEGQEPARRSREDDLPDLNKEELVHSVVDWELRHFVWLEYQQEHYAGDRSPGLEGRNLSYGITRRPRAPPGSHPFCSIEGMPMEILSAVLCREAKQTGPRDWSIAGEFDRVFLDSFPNEFGPVTVMINWRMEANEERKLLQIQVVDHQGNAVAPVILTPYPAPSAEESMSQRITGIIPARWESITFKTPGYYRAQVWIGEEVAWSKDFRVNQTRRG